MTELNTTPTQNLKNYNLFASVVSEFHLISVISFCLNKATHNNPIYGRVFISKKSWGKYLIPEQTLEFSHIKLELIWLDLETSKISLLFSLFKLISGKFSTSSESTRIYVCGNTYPNLKLSAWLQKKPLSRRFYQVVYDEGLGSYQSLISLLRSHIRENGNIVIGCTKFFLRIIIGKNFLSLFSNENWTIFNKITPKAIIVNEQVTQNYKIALEQLYPLAPISKENKRVLFLSQPFVELGVLSLQQYTEFLTRINAIYQDAGYELLIKAHPVEKALDHHDLKYLDECILAEGLSEKYRPDFVAGLSSTSLITYPLFFKIPSISLSNILNNLYPNNLGLNIGKANILFKEYVSEPKNFEELKKLL